MKQIEWEIEWQGAEDKTYRMTVYTDPSKDQFDAIELWERLVKHPTDKTVRVDLTITNKATQDVYLEHACLDPEPPLCIKGHTHEWVYPKEIFTNMHVDPGYGATKDLVVYLSVCKHCGIYKRIDIWRGHPLGCKVVTYEPADMLSRAYVGDKDGKDL